MKLDGIHIVYNNYTFANDGIPPESYGGKVTFKDESGSYTQINLSPAMVDKIMQTVSKEVADNAKRMFSGMDEKSIRDSARPLCIESEVDAEDGEIVF